MRQPGAQQRQNVVGVLYPDALSLRDLLLRLLENHHLQEQLRSRLAVAEALTDGSGVGRLLSQSLAILNRDAPVLRSTITLVQQSTQAEVHRHPKPCHRSGARNCCLLYARSGRRGLSPCCTAPGRILALTSASVNLPWCADPQSSDREHFTISSNCQECAQPGLQKGMHCVAAGLRCESDACRISSFAWRRLLSAYR